MARTPIRNRDIPIFADGGPVDIAIAQGEQRHLTLTLTWLTDLTGFTLKAGVVEGRNEEGDGTFVPMSEADTPKLTSLTILDDDPSDNQFVVVFPHDLAVGWDPQPGPDDPVYGFFTLQVADTGVGANQQIFVAVRGTVEVVYNPLEALP